jgi:hypothetical protein
LNRKLPSGANKLDGSYPERLQLVDLLEAAFGRRAHRLNDEALCAWRKGGRPKTVCGVGFQKNKGDKIAKYSTEHLLVLHVVKIQQQTGGYAVQLPKFKARKLL